MKRFYKALKKSPRLAARVLVDRVADFVQERRLGIRSSGLIRIETLIQDWQGSHDYAPTSIHAFRAFMQKTDIIPGQDVFVDYGSGLGRVLVLASEYPFRKIIGVEVSQRLAALSRRNIENYRGEVLCRDISIWCGNADKFPLPDESSVIYFYNPFHGRVLAEVFDQMRMSLRARPRRLRIIYNNPVHFDSVRENYPWLEPKHWFSFEHECIIYEALQQAAGRVPGPG